VDEEIQGTEVQEAVQEAEVQEQAGANESPEITIDQSGELVIPESFWDPEPQIKAAEPAPEPPKTPEPAAHYTPEELAEAFISGSIDTEKLKPELAEYYKAIDAATKRRGEAERARQEMLRQVPPAPQSQASQPQTMSRESWGQLTEMGKVLAAKNYLGIKPEEFDEFDPKHVSAQNAAIAELRERAQQIAHVQAQQQSRQVQVAQMMRARQAEIINTVTDLRQKTPDFDTIDKDFYPKWRDGLPVKEYRAVEEIVNRGTPAQIRDLMTRVIADYRKSKDPSGATPKAAASVAPPPVISAGNAGDEHQGMVNVADLGSMSADDQVSWLVKNRFVK
jgi:hypothetical protein